MTVDWGQDPSVRFMRRVFERMEATHKELLESVNISPSDNRLRHWREETRNLFEQAWTAAARQGLPINEDEAGTLYALCFARTLRSDGVEIPDEALPKNAAMSRWVQQVQS